MREELSCKFIRGSLWDLRQEASPDAPADGLEELVRRNILSHLGSCRDCALHSREVRSLRSGLRSLPTLQVPPILTTRLLIGASRDRSRRLARRDLGAWLKGQQSRARLFFDNLLRPFAVPAAGGILTSFLCFGMIIDTLQVSPHWDDEIPLGMFTEVKINELSPFSSGSHDVMVQLTIDAQGKVTDYAVPSAKPSDEETQEIGNVVLFSTFTPATRFGQAVASKRLLYISHMSVKG